MSPNRHNWSQMSLDEFLGFYRGTIYPEMLQYCLVIIQTGQIE